MAKSRKSKFTPLDITYASAANSVKNTANEYIPVSVKPINNSSNTINTIKNTSTSTNKTVGPRPKIVVGGPARTLASISSSQSTVQQAKDEPTPQDMRRRAAEAAAARAEAASKPMGKLEAKLMEQKRQTREQLLDLRR